MSQRPRVTGCFLWDVDIVTEMSCQKRILHLPFTPCLPALSTSTNQFALTTTQIFPQFSVSWLKLLLPAKAHSISLLQLLNRWGKAFFFFFLKAKIIDRHHFSPVLAGSRRAGGQPEPGQGAALPAGLSQAAKRGREAAGEQPQARHGCIQRWRGRRSQRSAALRGLRGCGCSVGAGDRN